MWDVGCIEAKLAKLLAEKKGPARVDKNRFEELGGEETSEGGDRVVMVQEVDVDVGAGGNAKPRKGKRRGEITLDSGAGASCLPKGWLLDTAMKPRKKGVKFLAAQGSEMEYVGRKVARFRPVRCVGGKEVLGSLSQMEFHVTDATKALASAAAVVKAGNNIVMTKGGGYIVNEKTGERVELREKGGTFVFDVEWEESGAGEQPTGARAPFGRPE